MISYNLGLTEEHPRFDRFSYVEKMEYWALVWGDIITFAHNKRDIRGQIREEFAAGIIGINFHGVGDHILGHGGVEPYFAYLAGKDNAGLSIHGKGD